MPGSRRLNALGWRLAKKPRHDDSTPLGDPLSAVPAQIAALDREPAILYGRVVDAVAPLHCYRVLFERGQSPLPCMFAPAGPLGPFGAKDIGVLAPGTSVWVVVHPRLNHGVIFAVEPAFATDPTACLSDQIHQASRTGRRSIDIAALNLGGGGDVVNWSQDRPLDATTGGEWGAYAETGLRITLDAFMGQLAADEMCGVTVFYHDLMLRLAGWNLQEITASSERERLIDVAEAVEYRGETPYPWEHLGVLRFGDDPFQTIDPTTSQLEKPWLTAVEPSQEDQTPFHRTIRLGGYPGQGGHEFTAVPPGTATVFRRSDKDPVQGLAERFTTLAGKQASRSATGIFSIKQPGIAVPRRQASPEAATGDTATNYKFAGVVGSGPSHLVVDEVASPEGANVAADMSLDVVSYLCDWAGVHPIYYHQKDWSLANPRALPCDYNQAVIPFSTLATTFSLPTPAPTPVKVDDRYGLVDVYPNTSFINQNADGSISIGDGYGASIILDKGRITLSAPGDIWLKPGRDCQVWAGGDAVVRAKGTVDISATNGDARIKADRNLQLLGGNSGVGAVLLESKAATAYGYPAAKGSELAAGGVHIKATDGDVAVYGENIYARAGLLSGGGEIVLDATRGTIREHAAEIERRIASVARDYFGTGEKADSANEFSAFENIFGGGAAFNGPCAITNGGLLVGGNIDVVGGHIGTTLSSAFQGLVGSLEGESLSLADKAFGEYGQALQTLLQSATDEYLAFRAAWYDSGAAGNAATVAALGFSFRLDSQYRYRNFSTSEDPWQRLSRLWQDVPAVWTERPVVTGGLPTYPFPGGAGWKGATSFRRRDFAFFDPISGTSRDRDPATYGTSKFAAETRTAADGVYPVVV